MDSKIELLIDAVEKRDFLYNSSNLEYKNTKIKLQAWTEIAEEVGMTVDICKKKWKTLRDQFSRVNLKRLQSGQAAENVGENAWKFFERLQFLREHIKPRMLSTGNYVKQEILVDCLKTDCSVETFSELDPSENSSISNKNMIEADTNELPMEEFSESTNSFFGFPPSKKAKKNHSDIEQELIAIMTSINAYIAKEEKEDEDDLFCASLAKKIKKFPLKERNRIKVELLKMLNEKEEELFP